MKDGVGNGIEKEEGKTVGDTVSLTLMESIRLERVTQDLRDDDPGIAPSSVDTETPIGPPEEDGPGPDPVGDPGDEGVDGRDDPGEQGEDGLQCDSACEPVLVAVLGDHSFTQDLLISPEYLEEQKMLHAAPRGYGAKGDKWTDAVFMLMQRYGCNDVLDYGSGQGSLAREMKHRGTRIAQYDPAIPKHAAPPKAADLVVTTDVMEHIEPDKIDTVMTHIRWLSKKVCLMVIAMRPASKNLSDGRNAHILLRDEQWWREKVQSHGFTIATDPPISPSCKPSRELVWVLT